MSRLGSLLRACFRVSALRSNSAPTSRRLRLESLENRELLSATPNELVALYSADAAESAIQTEDELVVPRLVVTSLDDGEIDHSDDFELDGTPGVVTIREALDYVGKYYDPNAAGESFYERFVPEDAAAPETQYNAAHELIQGVYTTIYVAELDGASDGATIILNSELKVTKNVTIDGLGALTLTASGSRVLRVTSNTLTVTNLAISGGKTDNGGGVYVGSNGAFVASNVSFIGNTANSYGGALYNAGSATVLGSSQFDANEAKLGGAIYNKGSLVVGAEEGDTIVFTENVAFADVENGLLKYGSGGAIYNSKGSAEITNAFFERNSAGKYGGAISSFASLSVDSSTFASNSATTGGAVQTTDSATIANSTFVGNIATIGEAQVTAIDLGGKGGAIYASNSASDPDFVACLELRGVDFYNNYAEIAGGAIDQVSGKLKFGEGNFRFESNGVDETLGLSVVGGAVLCTADVYFSENGGDFTFVDNVAQRGKTIAATGQTSCEDDVRIKQGFGLSDAGIDLYDDFTLYDKAALANGRFSYDFFYSKLDTNLGEKNSIYVARERDGGYFEVKPEGANSSLAFEKLGIDEAGTYQLYFFINGLRDATYCLNATIGETGQFLVRKVETPIAPSQAWGGLEVASYSGLISKWEINWGDGSELDVYESLGDALTAYHAYEPDAAARYAVSIAVSYAEGGAETFENVAVFGFDGADESENDVLFTEEELDNLFDDAFVQAVYND